MSAKLNCCGRVGSGSEAPCWKLMPDDVDMKYGFEEYAGLRRGYAVISEVLLAGHGTCGCMRQWVPKKMVWFLPHSDAHHGVYPVPHNTAVDPEAVCTAATLHQQLVDAMPWTPYGFLVRLDPWMSYGPLRTLADMRRMVREINVVSVTERPQW